MKKFLGYTAILVLLGTIIAGFINYPKLNIITGFAAKSACSCIFISGRSLESVKEEDNNFQPVHLAEYDVNYEERYVTSTVFGLKKRKAVFVEGFGCILLPEDRSVAPQFNLPARVATYNNDPYPYGDLSPVDTVFHNISYLDLDEAVENAFDKPGEKIKQTRAVLVLYKDHLIAEKYAPGFTAETSLLGLSMTKSMTGAVLGVMEKQGRISQMQNELFETWKNDARAKITVNDLLQMNSGLEWVEDYSTISDVTKMLFLKDNMPQVQMVKPMAEEGERVWNYSSGTTNLLSGFIRDQFSSRNEYHNYWYAGLIDKIGMNSFILEPDYAGNYVGSSYSWATARDWAKFGVLYLNNGNWNGEQILNESWIEYSVTPVEGSNGEYGAHFWLNAGGKYPNVPKDLFSSNGFQGQYVFIIPSKDLVVVRFGLTEEPQFDVNTFLHEITTAIR